MESVLTKARASPSLADEYVLDNNVDIINNEAFLGSYSEGKTVVKGAEGINSSSERRGDHTRPPRPGGRHFQSQTAHQHGQRLQSRPGWPRYRHRPPL